VAATYDGTTMRLCLNGTQVASSASSVVVGDHALPLTLGARSDASNYLPGDLDEVAVHDYALGAQQVAEHHGAGRR
jgi:Concanavalin A-like lectin/glucanases superfamily